MAADIGTSHAPTDPVEMRRLNFQTPGMISHPPIPISELANHIERLKANDNLKFSQEYEVCIFIHPFNPLETSYLPPIMHWQPHLMAVRLCCVTFYFYILLNIDVNR
jgi:hypothetical protein